MKDLTRFVGSRSGRLPTVGDVPPYGIIGVSPSKYLERDPDPPYVRRDIDELVDDALVEQRFLVVVGPSKAGKSRSAFEAMRRLVPTSTLVVPFGSSRPLAELIRDPPFDVDAPLPVLWLDDLDRYLGGANGVDHALLDECGRADRRWVLLGTIGQRWRDRLVGVSGAIGSAARAVLEQATQLTSRFGRLFGRILGDAEPEQEVEREQFLDEAATAAPNSGQLLLRELAARVARVNEMLESIVRLDRSDPEPSARPPGPAGELSTAHRRRSQGAFTLKMLSELTGVPPGTLRTWERRYRFTHPSRSAAGYRQYGDADVARILQIKQLRERGVRIGEAVQIVSESVTGIPPEDPAAVSDPASESPTDPGSQL